MSTKRNLNKVVERKGIRYVRGIVEDNNCIFQEIDLDNDQGNDYYIEFISKNVATSFCVFAQIKSGKSYRDSIGYKIPADKEHLEYWKNSVVPIVGIVYDEEKNEAFWENILGEICRGYHNQSLDDYLTENFDEINLEDLVINNNQRLLLVGFGIDEALSRMIEWLSTNFNLSVNAIILSYAKTSSNNELLSRTVIIPEEVEKQKANKKKFTIAMSDNPGEYEDDKLKELLKKYLGGNLHSARRMKDVILPALLKGIVMSREQLKKELVKAGEASDDKSGYIMSLISGQLGHEWKDYLRQVIEYGYPNYHWEKDNFKIREGYQDLVKEVLEELKEKEENH